VERQASRVSDVVVRVRVPAKVNLFLGVRGIRDDGYHEVVSIMQTVGLHDVIEAQLFGAASAQHPAARKRMTVTLGHDGGPRVPDGDGNLALRAARRLAETFGAEHDNGQHEDDPRSHLELHKRIPVAAGMAGGSADAAAALVALNELWGCELDRDELRAIGAELGADVPFCVTGGTALATGTGTATAQVLCRGTYHWVVGVQDEPLPTAEVYRTWDRIGTPSEVEPDAVLQALRTEDPEALGAALYNDLQLAAFHVRPHLGETHRRLLDEGALGALVSGSGPTLVALAESASHARHLAGLTRDRFSRVHVVTSPAGGPDLT